MEQVSIPRTYDVLQRDYREYCLLKEKILEIDKDGTLFNQFQDGYLGQLDNEVESKTKIMRRTRIRSSFANIGLGAGASFAYNHVDRALMDAIPEAELAGGFTTKDLAYALGWAAVVGTVLFTSFKIIHPFSERYENRAFIERSNYVAASLPLLREISQEIDVRIKRTG